ncbi:MAG: tetratricopeptide repeat protein [Bdellovibrionaceae bacterium]|nr:tetratricopeptide repeat protein [Pseudobdellovibrionaceae bacterium]MDW8191246.1 tetratricopeptide repeat protein [Pseudobdellovibrionaceae bacterium]
MSIQTRTTNLKYVFNTVFIIIIFLPALLSCTSRWEKVHQLGIKALDSKDYMKAVSLFERSFEELKLDQMECHERCFQVAGEIAQIYLFNLKNPHQAIQWLRVQRLFVTNETDLINLQKQIIRLSVDYLNDHKIAVTEAYKLLNFNLNLQDFCEVIFSLTSSLFELGDRQAALREVSQCLGNIPISETLQFNLAKLEVDILMSEKKYDQVIDKLKILIQRFDQRDHDGGLRLQLALAYEEQGLFAKAYELLDEVARRDPKEQRYIHLRKERLRYKEKNQAGAKLKRKVH